MPSPFQQGDALVLTRPVFHIFIKTLIESHRRPVRGLHIDVDRRWRSVLLRCVVHRDRSFGWLGRKRVEFRGQTLSTAAGQGFGIVDGD